MNKIAILLIMIAPQAFAQAPNQKFSRVEIIPGPQGLVLGSKPVGDFLPGISSDGTATLLPGAPIGRFTTDRKFISQPERVEIQGAGSKVGAVQASPPTSSLGLFDVSNTTQTPEDIAGPTVPPSWFDNIGFRSTMNVDPNTAAINTTGFAYFMRNLASSDGTSKNGVGYGGVIKCIANSSKCWAMNPTLIDADANGAVTNGTGKILVGAEFNLTATSPNTSIQGISLLGSSQANPAGADGFTCGGLGGSALWKNCFVSGNGTGTNAWYAGSLAKTGVNSPSQYGVFGYRNASGQVVAVTLQASLGALQVAGSQTPNGVSIGTAVAGASPVVSAFGSDTTIDLTLSGKGSGIVKTTGPFSIAGAASALAGLTVSGGSFNVTGNGGAKINEYFQVTSNASYVPYLGPAAIGFAITGNKSGGSAETDFWNTFPNATKSFAFMQVTGNGTATTVLEANTNGLVLRSSAFAALPATAGAGSQLYCSDCREPGQAAGAGTGITVFRNASGWRSSAGGAAAN